MKDYIYGGHGSDEINMSKLGNKLKVLGIFGIVQRLWKYVSEVESCAVNELDGNYN